MQVFWLINLRELAMSGNHLTAIQAEIGLLKELRILGLNNNRLTVLPPEISQLKHLKILGNFVFLL